MIFRVFPKNQLEELYQLLAVNHILDDDGWRKEVNFNAPEPTVFFGLHACDINALNKLDKVLSGTVYPDPYYTAKRNNMFIVGVNCLPSSSCFCRSMGSDSVLHGFDMFLTDIGDAYFVEILSAKAFEYINAIKSRGPDEYDDARFRDAHEKRLSRFSCHVDTNDLTKILDLEFQADVWKDWGKKCLSCGTCASVCPTCYCYDVSENVDLDLSRATWAPEARAADISCSWICNNF